MTTRLRTTLVSLGTAIALAVPVAVASPAAAAYDSSSCWISPLGCTTAAMYPHSSAYWLRANLQYPSGLYCPISWELYDVTAGYVARSGTTTLYGAAKTLVFNNLNANHTYNFDGWSTVCVARIRLANYT